jgi:hypothetical protein
MEERERYYNFIMSRTPHDTYYYKYSSKMILLNFQYRSFNTKVIVLHFYLDKTELCERNLTLNCLFNENLCYVAKLCFEVLLSYDMQSIDGAIYINLT